jgi:glycosyltransferase involved in cell wall biosynthesis
VMEGATNFQFDSTISRIENSYLWVGGLNKNKDPITILKAFNRFLEINPLAKLTMIFHENDLLNEVENSISNNKKLEKAVFLKGYIANKELEKIYNVHQFFVLGSHYEGSGYALLEAMACGCVPIVTNIPSFNFMTNNGDCGLLFSPSNEDELFNQFANSQKTNFLDYQIKVLKKFQNKLSFDAIAKDIQDIFQSL